MLFSFSSAGQMKKSDIEVFNQQKIRSSNQYKGGLTLKE